MLSRLYIQNYAIIDKLEIHFREGMNIITGETGAGKSILMGALNLVMGTRADSSVLHDAEMKCIVEAVFTEIAEDSLKTFYENNDLDFDAQTVIRREISAAGKSRAFVNDTPVNLSQLKSLSLLLADLHQQFDIMEIGSEDFQLDVLDALADNRQHLAELKNAFESYTRISEECSLLKKEQESAARELDYNQFLYSELEKLALKEDELDNFEQKKARENINKKIKVKLGSSADPINFEYDEGIETLTFKRYKNDIKIITF